MPQTQRVSLAIIDLRRRLAAVRAERIRLEALWAEPTNPSPYDDEALSIWAGAPVSLPAAPRFRLRFSA